MNVMVLRTLLMCFCLYVYIFLSFAGFCFGCSNALKYVMWEDTYAATPDKYKSNRGLIHDKYSANQKLLLCYVSVSLLQIKLIF